MAPDSDLAAREHFEALVAEVLDPLQRYLRRRTDPAAADDVLGDVLLVLWRRLDDIPADATVAWCYGVARGCLANSVRGAQRHQRLLRRLSQVVEPATSSPSEDPDLDEALRELKPADRELLRLWAWERMTPREIAVVLGITPNAASIRLHRATGKLRDVLQARKNRGTGGHLGQRQGTEAPR